MIVQCALLKWYRLLWHKDSSVNIPIPPGQHHCCDEAKWWWGWWTLTNLSTCMCWIIGKYMYICRTNNKLQIRAWVELKIVSRVEEGLTSHLTHYWSSYDITTCTKFFVDQFKGFDSVGGQNLPFSIDEAGCR